MFNNMENRDLNFDNNVEKEEKRRGIWLILLYVLIIIVLLFGVFITSANFLKATIKQNEIIVPSDDDDDKDIIIDSDTNTDKDEDKTTTDTNSNINKNDNDTSNNIIDSEDKSDTSNEENKDTDTELKITFTEQDDTKIRMYYTYPVSEEKALSDNNIIKFEIKNQGDDAIYGITIEDAVDEVLQQQYNNKRIDHKYLRYYLKNMDTNKEYRGLLSDLDSGSYICTEKIKNDETVNFIIAIWVDKDAGNEIQNSFYVGKLHVDVKGA